MKKIFFAALFFMGTVGSCLAQSGSHTGKFSIGINPGLPVNDAYITSSFAIGADVKYDMPITGKTYINLSGGYTRFFYNSQTKTVLKSGLGITKSGEGFVPLKAGIKYFVDESFYIQGQLGAAITAESGGNTYFAYSPCIGFKFGNCVDLSLRYERWSHEAVISQLALRLGFIF